VVLVSKLTCNAKVRLLPGMYQKVKELAAAQQRSVGSVIRQMVAEALAGMEREREAGR
jgi:hypothetical protein